MTVRFKSRSEYQKSYGASRSRSVSPQRIAPVAGLRSDQMVISREPCFQRRKRLGPVGLTQSCSSLLCPPSQQQDSYALKTAPSVASRSHSANRRKSPAPPTPPEAQAAPESAAEPEVPAGPRPSADPESVPSEEPGAAEKPVPSVKLQPSKPDSRSQLNRPLTAADNVEQPSASEVNHVLRRKAGLKSGGQRSGGHWTEYNRQFSWKKPIASASPLLTAEQEIFTSNRSVPPFKKNPVPVETEYRRSFQGVAPPTGPRLRRHLEQQRIPLFHTHKTNRKSREELQQKPRPSEEVSSPLNNETTPPPQVQRAHRIMTEYESSFGSPLYRIPEESGAMDGDTNQVTELRQKALTYRQRAWGANFSRDHLSQLLSEHNALWEPTDTTTDSTSDPPAHHQTLDPSPDPDSPDSPRVEALDLPSRSSNSSKRSSVVGSGVSQNCNKNTQIKVRTPASPPAERRTAWGEDDEKENTEEEEGRLPTPRLKLLPVQRTHHDLTTPAAGGAILVGKKTGSGDSSPYKEQRSVSSKSKEAWSENNSPQHASHGSSPNQNTATSPPARPIRTKQTSLSPAAHTPLNPPPLHGIQGTLRHPDFQHNGELGLRFRELLCSGGGCGSDDDDRLSVMSWRSAASCSMASAVLERAQKRRENFWGKR